MPTIYFIYHHLAPGYQFIRYSSDSISAGSGKLAISSAKPRFNIAGNLQTMNPLKTLTAIICMATLFSCKKDLNGSGNVITQQRTAGNFTAITSKGDFRVVLTKGQTTAISLTGEDNVLEKTVTDISNGKLTVRYADGIRTHKNKQVTVNVTMPGFTNLQLEGSGSIHATEAWSTTDLTARINGSGNIELAVDGNNFSGEINGSGRLVLNGGNFQASSFLVNGSGTVKAYPFTTNTADINIQGSGDCSIKVNNKLKVKINGSGTVYYKGSPDTNVSVSGSGKVVKQN
ncbi:MAG: DUF2807 domain-containing protein [Williamsia sp.]|nr:DUF2807 domain-containing protein [Williamsia sp.]